MSLLAALPLPIRLSDACSPSSNSINGPSNWVIALTRRSRDPAARAPCPRVAKCPVQLHKPAPQAFPRAERRCGAETLRPRYEASRSWAFGPGRTTTHSPCVIAEMQKEVMSAATTRRTTAGCFLKIKIYSCAVETSLFGPRWPSPGAGRARFDACRSWRYTAESPRRYDIASHLQRTQ